MNKPILAIIMAYGLFVPMIIQAQGTIYLSNISQTSSATNRIGSDSWWAEGFLTGTNSSGYVLNSVQLLLASALGNPNGMSVSLFGLNSNNQRPSNDFGSLDGSLNPMTSGIYSYTTSGIMLSPQTVYFIVVTAATSVNAGSYGWRMENTSPESPNDWSFYYLYFGSSDGLNWQYHRLSGFQLAINATPVSEPAIYPLAALGLASFSSWRRRNR